MKPNFIVLFLGLTLTYHCTFAQQNVDEQFWLDLSTAYIFPSAILLMTDLGLHSDLTPEEQWNEIEFANTFSYNIIAFSDLRAGLYSSFQNQGADDGAFNTIEIRPWIGTKLFFTPNSKFMTSLYIRLENRFFFYLDETPNTNSIRLRARPEVVFSINRSNFFQDKLWFLVLDFEYFWNLNDPPNERFLKNIKIRGGLGYRFNRTWQLRALYHWQKSRNTIEEDFQDSSNIFNIQVLYFFPLRTAD